MHVSAAWMGSPSDELLVRIALDALEEALATAHQKPVRRTWALRLALAFLASRRRHGSSPQRWPFDRFWQSLEHQRQQDRWANLNAALNGIYLTVGEKRDHQRASMFASRARSSGEM